MTNPETPTPRTVKLTRAQTRAWSSTATRAALRGELIAAGLPPETVVRGFHNRALGRLGATAEEPAPQQQQVRSVRKQSSAVIVMAPTTATKGKVTSTAQVIVKP
jgi:hypothetical protein